MRAACPVVRGIVTSSLLALAVTACARGPEPIALITVSPTQPGRSIPAGFLGLSHEWGQAQLLMGDPAIGVNPIYRQLVRNLAAYGGGPVSLRIGGGTTDRTGPPRANTITPLARLYEDLSTPAPFVSFILGVNLGADDARLAARQARAYTEGMPFGSIEALEIGNQPDTYEDLGYRRAGWGWAGYLEDFRAWTRSIRAAVPDGPAFMAPSNAAFAGHPPVPDMAAGGFGTEEDLTQLLAQAKDTLAIVSQHAYATGGSACGGNPTPGFLLAPTSTTESAALAKTYVALARSGGKPYRISEMNSIMCGGEPGVSDAFEAALWAVDMLFEYAAAGVVGVNVHTNNWDTIRGWDAQGAFLFDVPERQYTASNITPPPPPDATLSDDYRLRAVLPLYYGLWLFAEATGSLGQMVPAAVETTANLKAWATLDPATDDLRVAVINKDQQAAGTVRMIIPGYPVGNVKRLLAPSIGAKEGITYGMQTFDGSLDGKPVGTEQAENVRSAQNGVFTITIAPASAVLLIARK